MSASRLTFRFVQFPLMAGIYSVLFLALASCSSSVAPTAAQADDSKDKDTAAQETDPAFIVPDGPPEEILAFTRKLQARKPNVANEKEQIEYIIKVQLALITAGGKILDQEVDEKVATQAAKMKLTALTMLASGQIGDYSKQAMAEATKLKRDARPGVAKVAEQLWNPIRMFNVENMSADDRRAFTDEMIKEVGTTKFSRESIGIASQLGEILADKGFAEEAGSLYDRLAALASESDPKFQPNAERFKAIGRRLRLPGHFMELQGKQLNGEAFDWASYRGKVVLVDFWATWCGPCVAELPNVKENYKKYHDKGFEVVGISLDKSRAPLDRFIKREEIPWVQLYDEELQKDEGWNHPMAVMYGISGIPAAILLDKDGKVISMRARGEDLTLLLEKQLGKVE